MILTLALISERVSVHLNDASRLIWSEPMLTTAIRSALLAVGRVVGTPLTLSGLDGATETTLGEEDVQVLVSGAVAYALTLRASGRFEDARAQEDLPDALGSWASAHMARFQTMLAEVKVRWMQTAAEPPYSAWRWEEE